MLAVCLSPLIHCNFSLHSRFHRVKYFVQSFLSSPLYGGVLISYCNWTKWITIQGVIGRVTAKSDERAVQGRFEITSAITP